VARPDLLIIFAGTLPAGGMQNQFLFGAEPFWQHLWDIAQHMILPAATLMLTAYGSYTLVVRSSMLETLGEDYLLTARAKGLPDRRWCGGTRSATRCCRWSPWSRWISGTSWAGRC
jgi:ABC-type dipeptide/oligopeptide/nickel transport system permease component